MKLMEKERHMDETFYLVQIVSLNIRTVHARFTF